MLQRSAITGFLFVVGIGINSPIMLIGATLGVFSGLVTAKFFQYDYDAIDSGLYGFNAALIGIAALSFFPATLFSFIIVILAGALSTAIMHFLSQKIATLPVYTTPFILSAWLLMVIMDTFAINTLPPTFTINAYGHFYVVMRGVGQIMLQGFWLSGLMFVVGLFLYSYKVAAWAVIGSIGGMVTAYAFSFSENSVLMGLYGFNASLTVIALAERYTKPCSTKRWPIFLGIVISVLFTRAFNYVDISALTAPFVLASWLVILLVKTSSNEESKYHKPEIS